MFGSIGIIMFCFFAILKVSLKQRNEVVLKWWYGNKNIESHLETTTPLELTSDAKI
jgi:hypothetical protein